MRILVTGVSGFIGRPLARRLVRAGHEVAGTYLGSEPPAGALGGVSCREVDLLDRAGMEAFVTSFRPDRVAHLAALSHVGSSWEAMPDYYRVNVEGTARLLDTVGETPTLLASSCEVYGQVPEAEQPIDESRPVAPTNPYALTKAAAERLVAQRGGTVARLFTVVGAGQGEPFALPSFARQLARIAAGGAEPILRVGNLAARRDFVHVDDAVRALAALLEAEPGEVVNVASGDGVSMREALELLVEVAGAEVTIECDEERLRPIDVPLYVGSAARLEALTGWERRADLRTAVADLWRATSRAEAVAG